MQYVFGFCAVLTVLMLANISGALCRLADHHERFPAPAEETPDPAVTTLPTAA